MEGAHDGEYKGRVRPSRPSSSASPSWRVPDTACTETYLVAGQFETEAEAERYARYLRTRFVRFLVSLRKPTQNALRRVYAFVPDLPLDQGGRTPSSTLGTASRRTRSRSSNRRSPSTTTRCSGTPPRRPMDKTTIEEILAPKPEAQPRIYAYAIDDDAHAGLLKVGQTTRDVTATHRRTAPHGRDHELSDRAG